MKNLLYLTAIFCLAACSPSKDNLTTSIYCDEIEENYKPYNGEEIGCKFHFVRAKYNNQEYKELLAHCADLSRPFVIDENCVDICATDPIGENSECSRYLSDREVLEIILVQK